MSEKANRLTELRQVRRAVQRAVDDVSEDARVVKNGADVTVDHQIHLFAIVAELDTKIAGRESVSGENEAVTNLPKAIGRRDARPMRRG